MKTTEVDVVRGCWFLLRSLFCALWLVAIECASTAVVTAQQDASSQVAQDASLRLPDGRADDDWIALVVLWSADGVQSPLVAELLAADFAVACLDRAVDAEALAERLVALRERVRIRSGGVHGVLGRGVDASAVLPAIRGCAHEFQSISAIGKPGVVAADWLQRLRHRTVRALGDGAQLVGHLRRLRDARTLDGAAGDVDRALDSFHDAAAVADAERYFAILPEDAVFLGTDPDERWTGAEFRRFAMRYFEGRSAWTYVPLVRHVRLGPGGRIAWFDEELDNASYGICRGSGVLELRGGAWRVVHYDLTVPVPNELMRGVVERIRAFGSKQRR